MEQDQQQFFTLLRGIHRELIISNWNTITQKQKQRKLFQLLDLIVMLEGQAASEQDMESYIKEIAKLISQGYVKG